MADILEPIVGIDFLTHHKLSPNVVCHTVFHHLSNKQCSCDLSSSGSTSVIATVITAYTKLSDDFDTLLNKWFDECKQVLDLKNER